MGQNREERKGSGDEFLTKFHQELEEDMDFERSLFNSELYVSSIIFALIVVRESLFPSDLLWVKILREVVHSYFMQL